MAVSYSALHCSSQKEDKRHSVKGQPQVDSLGHPVDLLSQPILCVVLCAP